METSGKNQLKHVQAFLWKHSLWWFICIFASYLHILQEPIPQEGVEAFLMFSVQHDNKSQIWTWEILRSRFKFVYSFLTQTLSYSLLSLLYFSLSKSFLKKRSEIYLYNDKHLEIKILAIKMDLHTSYANQLSN